MARTAQLRPWPRAVLVAAVLVSILSICVILYWAKALLIPLALASLLTFMLTPVVERLERWQLPRIPAVLIVALTMALLLGGIGWTVGDQLARLADDLPTYQENIKQKLYDVRSMARGGVIERIQSTFVEINKDLEEEERPGDAATTEDLVEEPVPVEIKSEGSFLANGATVFPVLEVVGTAGLVLVLGVFMLIKREDLLNRLVSLAGIHQVAATTKALDEAQRRISRYLLVQFLLNGSYGLVVGIALSLIGLPYSLLWGFCAALARYVPYVGPWFAALLPITVSLIHFPGWTAPLMVIAIFIVLELILNNVLEPWLYGTSVGLSEVAVIVAAVTWTLLWGPVGLVLATPITVCLVVLGKYLPPLAIFDRLLSQEAALAPYVWLYQRLLGRNDEDAEDVVEEHLSQHDLATTCDELLLPTLVLTKREWLVDRIDEDDQQAILSTLREVIDALPETDAPQEPDEALEAYSNGPVVIGFPIREPDDLVLQLMGRLLGAAGCHFESLSSEMLISERLALVAEKKPACVCLSSLPPGDLMQTRSICKRLLAENPDLKIIVGRWTRRGASEKTREVLRSVGVKQTVATAKEMRAALVPMVRFHAQRAIAETTVA